MQVLAERTRQALGLGDRDFHPTSLQAEHRALHEASVFGSQLHTLERSLAKWAASTEDVLEHVGRFLADAPRPRRFAQTDPTDPDTLVATPVSLPPEFTHLNEPSRLRRLAAGTPLAVSDMLRLGLEDPIAIWLAALDAAKERLSGVEHLRIRHDAARRALHAAARAGGADQVGSPAHTHLIQLEQEHEPTMTDFQEAQDALDRHLTWLVDNAGRIKAAVVAAMEAANSAAGMGALLPPEGLLLPFPEDLLERPEKVAAAAAPAGPSAAAAAAMSEAAVEAATTAAVAASGLDVPPPQLVMLGPEMPAGSSVGNVGGGADAVLLVPPGTAGVAAEAAIEAAMAVGRAAAEDAVLGGPRDMKQHERREQSLLMASATGGPAAARLYHLATRPRRREAVRRAWRTLVRRALHSERHKSLAEHAEEQMRDVWERAGLTGGFLMRPEAAPEYQMAGRRRLPGGGPLQFLRDTLLGPPSEEAAAAAEHPVLHRRHPAPPVHEARPVGAAVLTSAATSALPGSAAAGSVGMGAGLGAEPTAAAAGVGGGVGGGDAGVDYAVAAREQMHNVATHGTGGAGPAGEAMTSPPDTGAGHFLMETLTGPKREAAKAAAAGDDGGAPGAGAAAAAGGGTVAGGGFLGEVLAGPRESPVEVARDAREVPLPAGGTTLPPAVTADLAAAAREQMREVTSAGPAAVQPPPSPAGGSRTASGGPASFAIDTLLGPEPGPGTYMPAPAAAGLYPPLTAPRAAGPRVALPLVPPVPLTETVTVTPSAAAETTTDAAAEVLAAPLGPASGGDTATDLNDYPPVPYDATSVPATTDVAAQVAEQAAAAMIAADAAMEVSSASVDAAAAAAESAAAATSAAAAAVEAATDAAVMALEAGGGVLDVTEEEEAAAAEAAAEPSTPPRGASGSLREYCQSLSRVGAGDEAGASSGTSSAADMAGAGAGAAAFTADPATITYTAGGSVTPDAAAQAPPHPAYEPLTRQDLTSFGEPARGVTSQPPAGSVKAMTERISERNLPEVPADVGPAAVREQLGRLDLRSFGLEPQQPPMVSIEREGEMEEYCQSWNRVGAGGEPGVGSGGSSITDIASAGGSSEAAKAAVTVSEEVTDSGADFGKVEGEPEAERQRQVGHGEAQSRGGSGVTGVFGAIRKMMDLEMDSHDMEARKAGQGVEAGEPAGPAVVE